MNLDVSLYEEGSEEEEGFSMTPRSTSPYADDYDEHYSYSKVPYGTVKISGTITVPYGLTWDYTGENETAENRKNAMIISEIIVNLCINY